MPRDLRCGLPRLMLLRFVDMYVATFASSNCGTLPKSLSALATARVTTRRASLVDRRRRGGGAEAGDQDDANAIVTGRPVILTSTSPFCRQGYDQLLRRRVHTRPRQTSQTAHWKGGRAEGRRKESACVRGEDGTRFKTTMAR